MSIVTDEDRAFFEENGYVRLEGVVPEDVCERVVDATWEFLGHDPDDPETWYDPPEGLDEPFSSAGMVELYHDDAMWEARQHPRVYQAFAELLGEENLWVSIDRVNMTPPDREDHPELSHEFVHWDVDTTDLPDPVPTPYGVQGVLYLEDTSAEQGGFQCVPSLYRDLPEWFEEHPDHDSHSPEFDAEEYPVESIPGEQGDLVIWDRLQPHGNGINRADEPRLAQYILMSEEDFADVEARESRVESWRERDAPAGDPFPGDPRRREAADEPPELTPLGRKLLGLDPWPGWLD